MGWRFAWSLLLLPSLASAQGRALGPEPTEVWEGNIGYAATAASLLRCGLPESCPGTGHNCEGMPSATATLDVIPETPTLRVVHAQLNWVAYYPPDGEADAEVTLVPPAGDGIPVVKDDARSEVIIDQLDAQSCQLVGFLCPAVQGNCGVAFFSHHAVVTEALQAHRDGGGTLNGDWTLRDVQISGGNDGDPSSAIAAEASILIGGWSLYIVYEDAENLPLRRIYYYQGFELNEGIARTVRPRGFLAPADPVVDLTTFVLEGDAAIQGDSLTVNGQEVTDACNPNRNVFNSTVNTGRANGQCLRNVEGVDLDRFSLEGAVEAGDEEAEVTYILPRGDGLITQGEQLFTDWLILAFDHRLPNFETLKPEKNAIPPGRSEVPPGQRIEYTIIVENSGGDFARNVILTDTVPEHTTYVRGSTNIDRRPIADGPGETLPLQGGLNLSELPDIGDIAPEERHIVRFAVIVDADTPDGTTISNVANIDAADIDPVDTDPVVHTVLRGAPVVDAGTPVIDAAVEPREDAGVGPPPRDAFVPRDEDAAAPGRDASGPCPPGQVLAPRGGACVPLTCPDGGVLEGDRCVDLPEDPCGPGTRLAADGRCESICGEGLRWDSTCPGGGQCRHVDDAPCEGGAADGGGSSDGCGCRYTPAAPGLFSLLLPALFALRPRGSRKSRRRS